VATLLLFNGTGPAKITRACAEAEGLPEAGEKNLSLQFGSDCLYIDIRQAMEQYRPMVIIEDIAHLLRRRRKGRTNEALTETIAAELTLQPNPSGSYNL
jgi:hypothetical protein